MAAPQQIDSFMRMINEAVKRGKERAPEVEEETKPVGSVFRDFMGVEGIVDDAEGVERKHKNQTTDSNN